MFNQITPYLTLSALVLVLVLFVLVIVLWRGIRRVRAGQLVVMGHNDERDIVALVNQLDTQVRDLREAVTVLTNQLESSNRKLNCSLTNCAIIRYDAFRDLGGEQSASLAILDNYASGMVLTSIVARDFSRLYLRHIHEGISDSVLAPEEERAIKEAVPRPLRRSAEHKAKAQPAPEAARAFEAFAEFDAPQPDQPARRVETHLYD